MPVFGCQLTFNSVIKDEKDLAYVEEEIFKELERLKTEPVLEEKLRDIKSNLKYSFANSLGTTDGVAGSLAFYINLTTDPGTVNKMFELFEKVTPQDIMAMAKKYFKKSNSTVVTLTGGKTQ
jgi:zinc protease